MAVLFNSGILLFFALVTNMWDDEVFSLFVSRLPLSDLLDLMIHNFDEDAPAFNVLQHGWQQVAHDNPLLLRLMPFTFWAATIAGIGFLVNRIAGRRAMFWALIITALWPYHWILPIAMRWYSLSAALGIWNFYFFLRLIESQHPNSRNKLRSSLLFGALVALTGAALWYTVYLAPAFAAAELMALVAWDRLSRRSVSAWAAGWFGAVILYLPWLPTFLAQMGDSTGTRFNFKAIGSSLYVLWAGDFSIPTAFWISLPLLASLIVAIWLCLEYWSKSRALITVAGTLLVLMILFGVIESKRLLIISTFFSSGIGISVAAALNEKSRSMIRKVVVAAGILALIGFGGSVANIASQSGWFTYRWLEKVEETAKRIDADHPEALILSNSNSLAFYAHDPTGLDLAKYWFDNNLAIVSETKVWNTFTCWRTVSIPPVPLPNCDPEYMRLMEHAIQSHTDLVYVHQAFLVPSGSVGHMESVLEWLQALGFQEVDRWRSTPFEGGIERFLSLPDLPAYRITAIHLTCALECQVN